VYLVTVAEGTSLEQAEVVLQGHKIELPVINKDGKLVGLITFRDITKLTQNQMVIKTFTVVCSSSSYRCYG
jgi:IMP dehydrogenase